ncbi:diacylglycerol kinase family protein [Streptomyces laurentii]|uniref:diacylglycerol kinase n=1 Tax=Streptomyces laurentii TaxID=39478 RepID=UPI00367A9A42
MSDHDQLLVLVDPVARRLDGESVRIAKDVLSAGADAKICLPEGPQEFARALARRGHRRPVVLGDDRALLRVVTLLQRERDGRDSTPMAVAPMDAPPDEPAAGTTVSVVPIGAPEGLETTRALGVPQGAVGAARAVLDGVVRRLDLLVDDGGGVVLTRLDVPAARTLVPAQPTVWDTCRSLVRTLVRPPAPAGLAVRTHRLRIEADGVVLCDLDTPVEGLSATGLEGGLAALTLVPADAPAVHATVRTLSVAGPDFRYRADATVSGPVTRRTWAVREAAWGLTVPAGPVGAAGSR